MLPETHGTEKPSLNKITKQALKLLSILCVLFQVLQLMFSGLLRMFPNFSADTTARIKQGYAALIIYTCIWEMIFSNFGQDTGNPEGFRGFPKSLQTNAATVSRSGQNDFLPDHFLIR
jgi:hypothetical protein